EAWRCSGRWSKTEGAGRPRSTSALGRHLADRGGDGVRLDGRAGDFADREDPVADPSAPAGADDEPPLFVRELCPGLRGELVRGAAGGIHQQPIAPEAP